MRVPCALAPLASLGLAVAVSAGCSGSTPLKDAGGGQLQPAVSPTPTTSDTSSSDETGSNGSNASKTGGDCYVELFDADNFDASDDHVKLTEPGRYSTLKNLPGADQDWTDEADSIKVGPGATVTIWAEPDFKGSSQRLEPGSEHPHVDDEPSSLELTC